MSDRLVNIFFFLALVFVFILNADAEAQVQILLAFCLAGCFAFIAFIFNWLTIDGASAAFIFGTAAYGIGGLTAALVVLGFFVTASVLSKNESHEDIRADKKFRRNGIQVWANGFWFTLWLFIWYLSGYDVFLIASVAAIAAATADTWATEIGANRLNAKTWLITSRKKVQPGTDGGISIWGSLAALGGAILIAFIFWGMQQQMAIHTIGVIAVTGFLGCTIDSYIGARFQHKVYRVLPGGYEGSEIYISNNLINWISAGLASLISLILILITGL
ncbi:DUF92 domain-containing protein [Gracilimonas mengyeensis]|uniref:TIGR00297 family protein n=1 Tax=Gracilimonas mengyeensis TaxID=1302730 RepID=A0A521E0S8_9BACT|nr:DUF92 domain-containing protein [Gracilimonas mengyeensis]SMO77528.1 TIGR00297 family protein [Gracilimonas mengyeensis]